MVGRKKKKERGGLSSLYSGGKSQNKTGRRKRKGDDFVI